jgi:predicted O-methyltransferase YrrM
MNEYKAIATTYARGGHGIDVHCHDVGLEDPSTVAKAHLGDLCSHSHDHAHDHSHDHKDLHDDCNPQCMDIPTSYEEWINSEQVRRNCEWENNVLSKVMPDTPKPDKFDNFTLFQSGAEKYALCHTTIASRNIQQASQMTQEAELFMPCMVGTMESQFLKMQCQIMGARRCLDIGTFTGMSAIALAEGIPSDGKVVTLELYEHVAKVAQRIFDVSNVGHKIDLITGVAADQMRHMIVAGDEFDLIFIDADKENYVEYYELALKLLSEKGVILADNALCALLYDQETDVRSTKLHEFNQHVKNDPRTEQVILTVREGVSMIRPVASQ